MKRKGWLASKGENWMVKIAEREQPNNRKRLPPFELGSQLHMQEAIAMAFVKPFFFLQHHFFPSLFMSLFTETNKNINIQLEKKGESRIINLITLCFIEYIYVQPNFTFRGQHYAKRLDTLYGSHVSRNKIKGLPITKDPNYIRTYNVH